MSQHQGNGLQPSDSEAKSGSSKAQGLAITDTIQGQTGRICTCCGGLQTEPNQVDNPEEAL